ncbi:hypothetical protein F441_11151 [Phytophthora nicotianae CJ01A1]|uniref:Uncharacterized protein n=4 Tax=Phytophthora nicotianae TaxID=4792 RepID=W2Z4I4_PHYNI|nr:hypothetical protein L916_10846 [Phytophthora nicotianae]ETL90601.1 hypothetical protein L917_10753 [Phytophthora nicotianae]ETO72691.1 hypothetical protein F444_11293 [Phytophthora nicotianae P1976]ETP13818.1 hypothetical protein F441_11151 [Phytophthora nicotianae CJ01A1]ETP41871.1 hypothetical protein F442_11145 [Phytophthora nicotianae P10297]
MLSATSSLAMVGPPARLPTFSKKQHLKSDVRAPHSWRTEGRYPLLIGDEGLPSLEGRGGYPRSITAAALLATSVGAVP